MTPRRWILIASFVLSLFVFAYEYLTAPLSSWLYLNLAQYYGFIALSYLFVVLFPGPFYRLFPNAPLATSHRASLGALGIATFYFALLHALIGFFGLLEGFAAFFYLPGAYFWGMVLGMIALFILALLAGTSFDYARQKMGPYWKRLHRFVYLAAFLGAGHIVMAGSHFAEIGNFIPTLWIMLFFVLTLMHAVLFTRRMVQKHPRAGTFFWMFVAALAIALGIAILYALSIYAHGAHH